MDEFFEIVKREINENKLKITQINNSKMKLNIKRRLIRIKHDP